MVEAIRSEAVYMVTGDQLKQFANQVLAEYEEAQKKKDPLLSKKTCGKSEAARYLNKNRVTIYRMISDGRLKTTADGKIFVSSVLEYENGLPLDEKECTINKRGRKVYV